MTPSRLKIILILALMFISEWLYDHLDLSGLMVVVERLGFSDVLVDRLLYH